MKKFIFKRARNRRRIHSINLSSFFTKKALPIALVLMIATQLVSPFFVVFAQTVQTIPNKQVTIDSNNAYVVTSWDELYNLIQNGQYTENGQTIQLNNSEKNNLSIVINGKIAANKTINIVSGQAVSLSGKNEAIIYGALDGDENNYSIGNNKFSTMFNVTGGTLNIDRNVTLSGERAVKCDDTCAISLEGSQVTYSHENKNSLTNSEVSYTHSTEKDKYTYEDSSVTYKKSEATYDFSNSKISYKKSAETEFSYIDCQVEAFFGSEITKVPEAGVVPPYGTPARAKLIDENGDEWTIRTYSSNHSYIEAAQTAGGAQHLYFYMDWTSNSRDKSLIWARDGNYNLYLRSDGELVSYSRYSDPPTGAEFLWFIDDNDRFVAKDKDNNLMHWIARNSNTNELTFPTINNLSSGCTVNDPRKVGLYVNDGTSDKKIGFDDNSGTVIINGYREFRVYNILSSNGTDYPRGLETETLVSGNDYYIIATNGWSDWYLSPDSSNDNGLGYVTNAHELPWNNEYSTRYGNGYVRWKYSSDGTFTNTRNGKKMYWDFVNSKLICDDNYASNGPVLKLNGTQIYRDNSGSCLSTTAGEAIYIYKIAQNPQGHYVIGNELEDNGFDITTTYYVVEKSNGDHYLNGETGSWDNDSTFGVRGNNNMQNPYVWMYDSATETLYHVSKVDNKTRRIYFDGTSTTGVVEDSMNVPELKLNGTKIYKSGDGLGVSGDHIYVYSVKGSSGTYQKDSEIDTNSLTANTPYYLVVGDNSLNYSGQWEETRSNRQYNNFSNPIVWYYDATNEYFYHTHDSKDYILHRDGTTISIVDSTEKTIDDPGILKLSGTQIYKNDSTGLSTTSGDSIYVFTVNTSDNNRKGSEISGTSALQANTPYYLVAAGSDKYPSDLGLKVDGSWETIGTRGYSSFRNPLIWYYDATDKVFYRNTVDANGNKTGTKVLYKDASGNVSIEDKYKPVFKINNVQRYTNTSGLFTKTSTDPLIYMYDVNNNGSVGNEPDSLTLSNYYYIKSENGKYLKALYEGGQWADFENQTSKTTNNSFSWKYVQKNNVNVLYNETTEQYIYFDNNADTVKISKERIPCDSGAKQRWKPIAKTNSSDPSNWHHTDTQLPGVNDGHKGFFITATNNATINTEATYKDLYAGKAGAVKNYAPIVIDNSTFNMTYGSIENNRVGYTADESKSGKQVTGSNAEGNSVRDYIKNSTPTKTAGGVIFINCAKASIHGDSAIKQNRGDVGGILVRDEGTHVVLGGQFSPDCGSTVMNGGHIDQNVGFHYAGAALVENGAVLRMVGNSTMNNNVTWNRGGAVWATDWGTNATVQKTRYEVLNLDEKWEKEGVFIMDGGEMANNTAFVRAGAIEVESNSVFLNNGFIHDNYCRSLGGAIYVEGDIRGVYWYTLNIEQGYIGQNYSVRFKNNMSETIPNIGGNYDGKTIEYMNNILDRKLGQNDINGNPLSTDSNGNPLNYVTYPNRTADVLDYVVDRQYMGNGGGIWLCPRGGSVIVNLTDEHKVYVENNYASGHVTNNTDVLLEARTPTANNLPKGNDFYLHNSPDGHLILVKDYHRWIDETTITPIETEHQVYSGSLYLTNMTDQVEYNNQTHTATTGGQPIGGVTIVNNVSRDGGGIAADGLVAFGTATETNEQGAELTLTKRWSDGSVEKYPVTFKLFYYDNNNVLKPLNDENGNQNSVTLDGKPASADAYGGALEIDEWKAKLNIPTTVNIVVNGESKPYPLYKLNHPSYPNVDLDPSLVADVKKIIDADHTKPFTLAEGSLKIVIKEYDANGNEIGDVVFSDIELGEVVVKNSKIMKYDQASCQLVEKDSVNYTLSPFETTAINGEKPQVEKYINNVVHQTLFSFDDIFEYEIMAYVPLNAKEFVIYDTLETPLMFWNARAEIPQYTTDNQGNQILNSAFNLNGSIRIINGTEQAVYVLNSSDHDGSGNDTTSVVNRKTNGTKLTEGTDYTIKYNKISSVQLDNDNNIITSSIPSNNANDADTIFIMIDENTGIENVRGKWVALSFNAGIKPEYKTINKLKSVGWLQNDDSKIGNPILPTYTITGYQLPNNANQTDWKYLQNRALEELVDLVDITQASMRSDEDTQEDPYRFAKDRYGNYYALQVKPGENTWYQIDSDSDVYPTVANANERLNGTTSGFVSLTLTKQNKYEFNKEDDHLVAKLQESLQNGVAIIDGAFGEGQNMFAKDSEGNYYYRRKPSNLSDVSIWESLSQWTKATPTTNPSLQMAIERVEYNQYTNKSQGNNGQMRLTYNYNWPVENATIPHAGEKNQANYLITTINNSKSLYKTNIVTVEVNQPEKYVNNKIHEVLRDYSLTSEDNNAFESFDKAFEYEIMVYVPENADELIIWDTLKGDLMFVDKYNQPQYKTFTIGTDDNPTNTDIPNESFMIQGDSDTNDGMTIVSNSNITGYQLQYYDDNNHKGDGTGTVKDKGTDLNGPINTDGYIKIGDAPSANINWSTDWSNIPNKKANGNTIYVKIDSSTGIETVRGKWVKLAFKAKIRPSSYVKIVNKISKDNRYTTNVTLAEGYSVETPNPTPAGYFYRQEQYTTVKMNAANYVKATDTANPAGYYTEDSNGDFTISHTGTPDATLVEGTDYIYFYEAAYNSFVYDINDVPTGAQTQPVYIKKGWNNKETAWNWDKVTDDGYVQDGINLYNENNPYLYADVQEDGSHAGLANDAKYTVKVNNDWNVASTNTVTVVPLLRTITINKTWIVNSDTTMPTANDLLNHLHLYWEKVDSGNAHGKLMGDITNLYKDKFNIYQKSEIVTGEKVRYTWVVEVKDLPRLDTGFKYFISEDRFAEEGFERPTYINPEDPEARDHAHDKGTITNSIDDGPDSTQLLVTKTWDTGIKGEEDGQSIEVQLLANGEPIMIDDGEGNMIVDPETIKTLPYDGNWYYEWRPLSRYELDSNGVPVEIPVTDPDREYYYDVIWDPNNQFCVVDQANHSCVVEKYYDKNVYEVERNTTGEVETLIEGGQVILDPEGNPIPKYIRDNNGNRIPVTKKKEIVYSVKLNSDPEGYILSTVEKINKNVAETTTEFMYEAYDYDPNIVGYQYLEVVGGYHRDYDTENVGGFIDTPFTQEEIETYNNREYETFEDSLFYSACILGGKLPKTGHGVDQTGNVCLYKKYEEYDTYETELINTKPQIEKYINKDVHHETYFVNDFVYDIIAYIPNEATEIEITDELLPTLKLDSFLEAKIYGEETNRVVEGYDVRPLSSMSEPITLIAFASNNHTVNGTVGPVTITPSNQPKIDDTAKAYITVDGNTFKVKIENIVSAGSTYIEYQDGEYIYVDKAGKDSDLRYVKGDQIENGYVAVNDKFYRIVEEPYYVEANGETGDYYRIWNSAHIRRQYIAKTEDIPAGYERENEKTYNKVNVPSQDQKLGGYYVQVSFKARFNLDDEKQEALKNWIENPLNNSKNNPNPEFDWDVITDYVINADGHNKGWDEHVKQTLTSNSLENDTEYVVDGVKTISKDDMELISKLEDYLENNNLSLDKVIKYTYNNSLRFEAIDSDDNVYISMIKPTKHPWTEGIWFNAYVESDTPKFKDIDTQVIYSHSDIQENGGDQTAPGWIPNHINSTEGVIGGNYIPVEPDEYVKINNKYYLKEVADLYAPEDDNNDKTIYRKVDWGRGDGDIIRNNSSEYGTDKHAGIVNTSSYEVTYGNGYKSSHKSNTVTVVPHIYELPSSGGIGTFLFNILGAMFISLALIEFTSSRRRRKKRI